MTDRPLRAVKAGEKPSPAKKSPAKRAPRKFSTAAKGTRRSMLVALRDRLAMAIEDPKTHPRDLAQLAKQIRDIAAEIEVIDSAAGKGARGGRKSAVATTANGDWDEAAI